MIDNLPSFTSTVVRFVFRITPFIRKETIKRTKAVALNEKKVRKTSYAHDPRKVMTGAFSVLLF